MADIRHTQRNFPNGSRLFELTPSIGGMEGLAPWGPLFSNMQAWTRQMTQFNMSLQREWLAFIEKRLKQDAALTHQLAECKGPDEIARTYSEFMRTAFEDYQQEFTTFAKIGGAMASETIGMTQAGEGDAVEPGHPSHRPSAPQPSARKRPGSAADTEH